jgi:hypothetical protein
MWEYSEGRKGYIFSQRGERDLRGIVSGIIVKDRISA